MVSPFSHGASPLSPSGASEKRSSASEALMDPRALSFSVCFLLLSAEDPLIQRSRNDRNESAIIGFEIEFCPVKDYQGRGRSILSSVL
ncbi:hypothetical protein NPIL_288051 [Nephila pilipes]|uniref:Uncharacterized protein n=1 Tax=Nephila pilipes TaxID=299642 RepID=A0A8X6UTT3_NEPPI|nr:hypothetical protein NPIL_288051 [Nephila pilipes]